MTEERLQALLRFGDGSNVVRHPERDRRREYPIQQGKAKLVLPLEVEKDETMAQPRSGGHGPQGEAVDPTAQRDIVRSPEDLFPSCGLRRPLPWHARS
jgi:hypothetical protein